MVMISTILKLLTLQLKIQLLTVSHHFLIVLRTVMEATAIDSTSMVSYQVLERIKARISILEQCLHCHHKRSNLFQAWLLRLKCIILHLKISDKQLKWVRDRGSLNFQKLHLI